MPDKIAREKYSTKTIVRGVTYGGYLLLDVIPAKSGIQRYTLQRRDADERRLSGWTRIRSWREGIKRIGIRDADERRARRYHNGSGKKVQGENGEVKEAPRPIHS